MGPVALVSWFPDSLLVEQTNCISHLLTHCVGNGPSLDGNWYCVDIELNPVLAIRVGPNFLRDEVQQLLDNHLDRLRNLVGFCRQRVQAERGDLFMMRACVLIQA